jgi:Cu(I)/Ag(I) efflux system membrane fusion protein
MRKLIPALFLIIALFSVPVLAETQKYTCPMHPHYVADRPSTCPICGMDLVQVYGDGNQSEEKVRTDHSGRIAVTISPETIQNSGVRTEKAQMASFGTSVSSYGDVTENVRLQTDISGRVSGWVQDLKFKAEGDEVKKDDLLFTLDSPELISAQQDYISALKTGVKGRIGSAERRLRSLGVQKTVIADIRTSREAKIYVPFYAEGDGVIRLINIREGSYVKPGLMVMQIQDYASVWAEVSIAEQDIPYIDDKTTVAVSFPNLGVQEKQAKIDYIYPTIDRATRTGRVRLVLDNPDNILKPGAYADVEFQTNVERRLSIPSDAILKSKDGDFVVVALREGRFQPRKILSGLHYRGRTEVLKGLAENDNVVVSGQFLIDSESSLRESFRKMQRMQTSLAALEIGDDQMVMIDHLVDAALYIHEELMAERTPNPKMIIPAITLGDHLMPVFRGTKLQFVLEDAEDALVKGKESLTDMEWQDSLNELVMALKPWLLQGRPQHYKGKGLKLYMASKVSGGGDKYWVQLGEEIKNPYDEGYPMKIVWPENQDAEGSESAPEMIEARSVGGAHGGH